MATLESEQKVNQFLLGYARTLLGDLGDDQIAEQPLPGVNHPAWILGHLTFSTDICRDLLGAPKVLPEAWTTQYGVGSRPVTDRSAYPSKDELLSMLERGFAEVRGLVAHATEEQMTAPTAHPRIKDSLPTTRDLLSFLLTAHVAIHLGQLTTWRRMRGMDPMF